jgi:hypothetical protein
MATGVYASRSRSTRASSRRRRRWRALDGRSRGGRSNVFIVVAPRRASSRVGGVGVSRYTSLGVVIQCAYTLSRSSSSVAIV